ncbi:MAG: peptidoglycan-binding protein [Candidatus Sungbacteria bacterium]|uniref:Peptidoglycan-binding protein n=1 Tax=Candidatus Sungiibacteriota bacterium TaxID=2750080 RepID=A0A9D6QV99_9BACT|nr:peptidoglycan-binding protein [Candidatus Sungbacteria bacterium]
MKKIKFGLIAAGALFGLSASIAWAHTVDQDITVVLPSDGSSYILQAGSSYDTFDMSLGTFTFTMSSGETMTLSSSDRKNFNNSGGVTSCYAGYSKLVISPSSSVTVTASPSGTCSSNSSTSSSGSGNGPIGGGVGGSYQPMTVSTSPASASSNLSSLQSQLATLLAQATKLKGSTSVSGSISSPLRFSSQGKQVTLLQQILAKDASIYPEGTISGYFGVKTLAALKRFQVKYGIANPGDPGYGSVGPKTRAKLNSMMP